MPKFEAKKGDFAKIWQKLGLQLSSSEICSHLFLPIYSTTMLNYKSRPFTASGVVINYGREGA